MQIDHAALPALWCSRSTFWVSSTSLLPIASSRASARCASFGPAAHAPPADQAARPIALARRFEPHEGLVVIGGARFHPPSPSR